MPVINEVTQRLISWLDGQPLLPKPRELTSVGLLPAAAYPQLAVLALSEVFSPGDAEVTARLAVRVSYAAGRPADALATVRDLAHQVRAALNRAHGLGGTIKRLRVGDIRYDELARESEQAVVATATIALTAKYCLSPLD